MKIREIRNNSKEDIHLVGLGQTLDLKPGCSVSNLEMDEGVLDQLRSMNVSVKLDLSEVKGLLD